MLSSFTNVYGSFPNIQARINNMAGTQASIVGTSGSGARFQSLSDFEREQDELQAQIDQDNLNAQPTRSRAGLPAASRPRTVPDVSGVLLENQALQEMGSTNWVGKLLEYHQANNIVPPPEYRDEQVSEQRFRYSVVIVQNTESFTTLASFSNKKDAKQFISKVAIDWLISHNFMPSNGAVRFPKTPIASPILDARERSTSPTPYPSLVPGLCIALGFNPPAYKLTRMSEGAAFWEIYADFGSDPRADGPIGKLTNIYGKQKAKEACAKEVFKFLKAIERLKEADIVAQQGEERRSEEPQPQHEDSDSNESSQYSVVAGI
ncbi:uncharacterized protein EAF01_007408 [Botrytis porri]|uniref:DRBM domain-containing protein n=1 Tax=Botrytis porri TaxID=87229 RepID=A0A4Z1KA36_9HELO|nr:uncharacterized protein EAF01_007408 [Botrytis porri]KAF7902110.1 hypothetical protein EAF01_007408 [Botrytis porri]TGO81010.1 hypothetical protein BPOR_1430g00020 [Botrytis porri]